MSRFHLKRNFLWLKRWVLERKFSGGSEEVTSHLYQTYPDRSQPSSDVFCPQEDLRTQLRKMEAGASDKDKVEAPTGTMPVPVGALTLSLEEAWFDWDLWLKDRFKMSLDTLGPLGLGYLWNFGIFWILAVSKAPLRQRYRLCLRLCCEVQPLASVEQSQPTVAQQDPAPFEAPLSWGSQVSWGPFHHQRPAKWMLYHWRKLHWRRIVARGMPEFHDCNGGSTWFHIFSFTGAGFVMLTLSVLCFLLQLLECSSVLWKREEAEDPLSLVPLRTRWLTKLIKDSLNRLVACFWEGQWNFSIARCKEDGTERPHLAFIEFGGLLWDRACTLLWFVLISLLARAFASLHRFEDFEGTAAKKESRSIWKHLTGWAEWLGLLCLLHVVCWCLLAFRGFQRLRHHALLLVAS